MDQLLDEDLPVLSASTSLSRQEAGVALCAQVGWDLFFPEAGQGGGEAKAICAKCPLTRTEDGGNGRCLEIALANREQHGVWGGLTRLERQQVASGKTVPPYVEKHKVNSLTWRRHVAAGEPVCEECEQAYRELRESVAKHAAGRSLRQTVRQHGTVTGYSQHFKYKEKPCEECRLANAAYKRAYHATRPRKAGAVAT